MIDIEKAIPISIIGLAATLAGCLAAWSNASDDKLEVRIQAEQDTNRKQDIAIRELQINFNHLLLQQQKLNTELRADVQDIKEGQRIILQRILGDPPGAGQE